MKNLILFAFLLSTIVFLSGCTQQPADATPEPSQTETPTPVPLETMKYCESDEDCVPVTCSCYCSGCGFPYEEIVNKKFVNEWYSQQECEIPTVCLEVCCPGPAGVKCENNQCKVKLTPTPKPTPTTTPQTTPTPEPTPTPTPEPTPEPIVEVFCAEHFERVESSFCSDGGSIGSNPILDVYACKGDPDYPPASACPETTQMNNTYASASGSTPMYTCYVPQKVGATVSPAGCPIPGYLISCHEDFEFDEEGSKLAWQGGSSSWGCWFKCKATPDPYIDNPNWPCAKPGYQPISGGGGETCCATW